MAGPLVIAGGGIGGLGAALALAQRNIPSVVLEQADTLEPVGAGIQLSPNATRVLDGLGLAERLKPHVVEPAAVLVRNARGRQLVRIPLADHARARYGAPYWVVHRGDLQAELLDAARSDPRISLRLGVRVEDIAMHARGVTVAGRQGTAAVEESGAGLIGADGLWSTMRGRVGHAAQPAFRGRTAWRALLPAESLPEAFRTPLVQLWLGADAHLVAYPVRGGSEINVVAIVGERFESQTWTAPGDSRDLLARFSRGHWAEPIRMLLAGLESWQKWALADLPPLPHSSHGPVTLLGDAAHPMLPFMAQGAAAALEDSVVVAAEVATTPDEIPAAFRRYEQARRRRTARLQQLARRNGATYHLAGAEAFARDLVMRLSGGGRLLRRFDWIYRWKPPQ